MAKKESRKFVANLNKNPEKGGAWLAFVAVINEENEAVAQVTTAWANASAAKRWVKTQVQTMTPRKSVKMVAGSALDVKGKPVSFTGELLFKA
jgi:hypothetical protein